MVSFVDLPKEIHRRILSFLLSNEDVAALSVQCRALYEICEMDLRKKFDQILITYHKEDLDTGFTLLMEILKRPVLGRYVRQIECPDSPLCDDDYREGTRLHELGNQEIQLLRAASRKAGFVGPREDRVVNMLMQKILKDMPKPYILDEERTRRTFITRALTAVLIAVSPDLTSLHLAQPFFAWAYFCKDLDSDHAGAAVTVKQLDYPLASMLRDINTDPDNKPCLQNLRNVFVTPGGDSDDTGWDCSQRFDFKGTLTLVNCLPSIESVGTEFVREDAFMRPGLTLDPCKFSRIVIHKASVDSAYLAGLIASCETLRELQFSNGGRVADPGFDPQTVFKALCVHKQTLETLDINVNPTQLAFLDQFRGTADELEAVLEEFMGPSAAQNPTERNFLQLIWEENGSLKDFTSMKRLSLGIQCLLCFVRGVWRNADGRSEAMLPMLPDCLPDSLEYLCIRGYQAGETVDHDIQVDALMDYFESGLSPLKEIEGVDEMIPHAKNRWDVDGEEEEEDRERSSSEMGDSEDWY